MALTLVCYYDLPDDCVEDADCNGGTCVHVAQIHDYHPGKQCFCKAGRMGKKCELGLWVHLY